MNSLLLKVVEQLLPVFLQTYQRYTTANPGKPVTIAGLTATLHAEGDVILAEGEAWKASHPDA